MRSSPSRRAVATVILPREHLPFIREWCVHHVEQGWEVFLYDNSGSVGSQRMTSSFYLGRWHGMRKDKRGNAYGEFTKHLTDEEVSGSLLAEVQGLPVQVIPWRPRNAMGQIVHGQVEAYVDFITRYRDTISWAAFIDADEYLELASGLSWDVLLDAMAGQSCHRVMLDALLYETRWTPEGMPRSLQDLCCCGLQVRGSKNLIRLTEALRADIHWDWRMTGDSLIHQADRSLYSFRHYRAAANEMKFPVQRSRLGAPTDESLAVPLDDEWYEQSPVDSPDESVVE